MFETKHFHKKMETSNKQTENGAIIHKYMLIPIDFGSGDDAGACVERGVAQPPRPELAQAT